MTAGVVDADAVVIGGGVMGCAAARALAGAGREVTLLERFGVGHTRGSSHGRSRVFRFSYHEPRWVRMAMEALPLWRELEEEAGRPILLSTGGLDVGPQVDQHRDALEASRASFQLLDAGEVRRRWPFLALDPGAKALFQPDAGVVEAGAAWEAFAGGARSRGADVREGVRVEGLSVDGDRAVIRTAGERLRARVAVVTAGAWARGLVNGAGLDIPTTPTRETVVFFRLPVDAVPPVVVDWEEPPVYSLYSWEQGVKVAEHRAGPVTDPEDPGSPSERSIDRVTRWMGARFPDAGPEHHHAETCIYTNTPDEDFLLERHGPIVIGSPCSGHGFKFAPWIGRRLAELAGP